MDNIAILAGGDSTLLPKDHDVYVGVDGGCLKLLEKGLPLCLLYSQFVHPAFTGIHAPSQ